VPDLPEPSRLRACCIFGDEVGVGRRVPIPGYEVVNVLEVGDLGTHGGAAARRWRDAPDARAGEISRHRAIAG
jgi:hypothetical protein